MLNELRHAIANGAAEGEMKSAAARLLKEQFLYREESGDKAAYTLVRAHLPYFTNLFEALGWTIERDDQMGFIGAIPVEGAAFTPIKVDETLVLLVLRQLFEEAVERHDAGPEGATVTAGIIANAHLTAGRPAPMGTRMRQILAVFQRRGLILCDLDSDLNVAPVVIRSSIRLVTGEAVQAKLAAFATLAKELEVEPEEPVKADGGES